MKRFYGQVNKVPILGCTSQEQQQCCSTKVTEVGEVEEVEDLLLSAEVDPGSGPSFDVRLFERFLGSREVQQRLPLLCLTATEMCLQANMDAKPVCIIRYRLTDRAADLLRNFMMCNVIPILNECYIHVAYIGSEFDQEACGKHRHSENSDIEFRIMQPTMSSTRLITGDIVSGSESDFSSNLNRAVTGACQAAQAVQMQRELLERDRAIRRQQEEELRLSEAADKDKTRKSGNQAEQVVTEKENEEEKKGESDGETSLDATVLDDEEVRKRRLAALDAQGAANKRQRRACADENDTSNDSGTVTFKET